MAIFEITGCELFEILAEHVGFKAGLALNHDELVSHMPTHAEHVPPFDAGMIRMRHGLIEGMLRELLFRLGAVASPDPSIPSIRMMAKYHGQAKKLAILRFIVDEHNECVRTAALTRPFEPIDLTPVAIQAITKFRGRGAEMWREYFALVMGWTQGSLLSSFRRIEWENIEKLETLFASENVACSPHGTFIDQRFVDYLARNFESVDGMHWRQFEALVSEYFDKKGYAVELGPGRNDGGIDIRVWRRIPQPGDPATLLVQCKRRQDSIGKTVVKALWSDLVAQDVPTGLIVTTHAVAPGAIAAGKELAANPRVARSYHVGRTERDKLRKWIESMRTPGTGLFVP